MEIRAATDEDIAAAAALRMAFLGEVRQLAPDALEDPLAEATRRWLREASTAGRLHTWLAHDGELTVGLVSLAVHEAPPLPGDLRTAQGVVLNLYVVPARRGRGVARALMATALATARRLDLRNVALVATEAGRPLYWALGFGPDPRHLILPLPGAAPDGRGPTIVG